MSSSSSYEPSSESESDESTVDSDPQNEENEPPVVKSRYSETKKRARNDSAAAVRKSKRNLGLAYTTAKKKNVPAKEFDVNFDCKCKNKCPTLLSIKDKQVLFTNFWRMDDFQRQNAYLCGMVVIKPVVQRHPCNENVRRPPKSKSVAYFLQTDKKRIKVCKKFFLYTFQVSDGRVSRAIAKVQKEKSPGEHSRGKAEGSKRQLPVDVTERVIGHIKSFPSYQSHYTRMHNQRRKYLNPKLNVRKMYDLYVGECKSKRVVPAKLSYYRWIFNTKFNLHFHVPRKDTCQRCDALQIRLEACTSDETRETIIKERNEHQAMAETARQEMRNDAAEAQSLPSVYACSFDLQKALPFPVLSVSVAYYKRNMYCYNLGINDLSKDLGTFHVWNETDGKRGSQEIAACLIKHFKTLPPSFCKTSSLIQ